MGAHNKQIAYLVIATPAKRRKSDCFAALCDKKYRSTDRCIRLLMDEIITQNHY